MSLSSVSRDRLRSAVAAAPAAGAARADPCVWPVVVRDIVKRDVFAWAAGAADLLLRPHAARAAPSMLGFDGQTFPVAPSRPRVATATTACVFVNGAGTNIDDAQTAARLVADVRGSRVDLVYNATETRQFPGHPRLQVAARLADWHKDLRQLKDDFHDRGTNLAVTAVADRVLAAMRAGEPLQLVGFSQGSAIIARALRDARRVRLDEFVTSNGGDEATAKRRIEAEFALLRVANLSGPTCRRDLPEELPASHYLHAEFPRDPVFRALGEGADAGRDAAFDRRVDATSLDLMLNVRWHDLGRVLEKDASRLQAFFGAPADPG